MEEWTLERIRAAFRDGHYRLTLHAETEREADEISVVELEDAFGSDNLELIEEYSSDPRGRSALFLAYYRVDRPLHCVLGLGHADIVVVVTVYRPDPKLWRDWRERT